MVKYILTISFFCVFVKGTKKLLGENLKNIAKLRLKGHFYSAIFMTVSVVHGF